LLPRPPSPPPPLRATTEQLRGSRFVMRNALANTAATRGALALANAWLRDGFLGRR